MRQTMSDLIERDKVAELFKELFEQGVLTLIGNDCLQRKLEAIPSARPKEGKWIEVTNGRGGHECSECHDYAPSFQSGAEHLSHFCPNCGADMREREGE